MRGLTLADAESSHGCIEGDPDIGRFFDNSVVLVPSYNNSFVGDFKGRNEVDGLSFFDYLERVSNCEHVTSIKN